MANIPQTLSGDEDLSARHAVKQGAHDALSTMVQYAAMFAAVGIVGYVLLDKATINKIKKRWL